MNPGQLIIIDISSFIFRAFYAIRPLHSPEGVPVNAVHGVLSMLLKLLENYRPTHILVAQDSPGPCFRHEIYPEYKANRGEPPEELIPQFDLVTQLLERMELPHMALKGYEADDLIGSICTQWRDHFEQILIASSDKDLMQFVSDKVKMLDTMKDKIYDREGVFEKLGVWPEQVVDYLSMLGDSSDNIPGMKGIGAKGASQLLADYHTLEGCIENAGALTNKRLQNAFAHHLDDAHLSKELIAIPTDLKLAHAPDDTQFQFSLSGDLVDFLNSLDFKSLLKKIETTYSSDVVEDKISEREGHLVGRDQFQEFYQQLRGQRVVAIESYFSSRGHLYPMISLAVSFDGEGAYYLPVSHSGEENLLETAFPNLTPEQVGKFLRETVGNGQKTLIGNRLKQLFAYCYFNGLDVSCQYADNMVGQYVGNSSVRYKQEKSDDSSLEQLMAIACEQVVANFQLHTTLEQELARKGVEKIYRDMEIPLIPISGPNGGQWRAIESGVSHLSGGSVHGDAAGYSGRNRAGVRREHQSQLPQAGGLSTV